jgi:hypothetical protein
MARGLGGWRGRVVVVGAAPAAASISSPSRARLTAVQLVSACSVCSVWVGGAETGSVRVTSATGAGVGTGVDIGSVGGAATWGWG